MMQGIVQALVVTLFLTWPILGSGQNAVAAERSFGVRAVSELGVLILDDDRQVCLDGIWPGGFSPPERSSADLERTLHELIDGRPVRIDEGGSSFDRYGCLVAHVETDDGVSLQQALLERGLAMVNPAASSASSGNIEAWLTLEEKARQAKVGLWRNPATQPRKASATFGQIGRTSLVQDRVVRVSSNDRYVYLNFGQDWRTDFTVRVRRKLLKQGGLEPSHFDGKTLRVRGFVQEARGPLIDISHLKQIEVIP